MPAMETMERAAALRREIIQVCRLMYDHGLVAATDGNVTARLDDTYVLATPSGISKGWVTEEQLIILDLDANVPAETPYGPNPAGLSITSEIWLHLEVYKMRPDVGAVVHAHPPYAIALSIAGVPVAECLIPEVLVGMGMIPLTPYATPSTREGAEVIHRYIGEHDAVVLRRHGSVTVDKTPLRAYLKLEKLEHAAHITYLLQLMGCDAPIPPAEVAKLIAQRRARRLASEESLAHLERLCRLRWHRTRRRRRSW